MVNLLILWHYTSDHYRNTLLYEKANKRILGNAKKVIFFQESWKIGQKIILQSLGRKDERANSETSLQIIALSLAPDMKVSLIPPS